MTPTTSPTPPARPAAVRHRSRPRPVVRLRHYDIILVNSSAGKDSQAMLDVVCAAAGRARVLDRVTVLHCDLGRVAWPGTAELARLQAARYGVRYEQRSRTKGLLLDQVRQRGKWPSATARYWRPETRPGNLMPRFLEEGCGPTVPSISAPSDTRRQRPKSPGVPSSPVNSSPSPLTLSDGGAVS